MARLRCGRSHAEPPRSPGPAADVPRSVRDAEWTNYHAEGHRIFTAYANGIKANEDNLPVELTLTGIRPLPWTAETVALREPAFGNAVSELRLAMDVAKYGVKEANRRAAPDPWDELTVPKGLDASLIVPGISRPGDGLEGQLRKPDLRRRRRQHRLPGIGLSATAQRLERPAAGARHRRI